MQKIKFILILIFYFHFHFHFHFHFDSGMLETARPRESDRDPHETVRTRAAEVFSRAPKMCIGE